MSSIRVNFPLIGTVKVKAHNSDESKYFLKGYSETALSLLRESIPEISEPTALHYGRYGASVDRAAFAAGASKAYAALGEKAILKAQEALDAQKADLPNAAAATGDFVANISARLAEQAAAKAQALTSAPVFAVVDGGLDSDGYESDDDSYDDSEDDNDNY